MPGRSSPASATAVAPAPTAASAFSRTPRLFSLREVRQRYPAGVHPKDMAWMMRRLLTGLGHVHANGIVHGAITPDHFLIQPDDHGLVFVDWKYAVEAGGRVKALSAPWRAMYPPEILAKERALAGTDVFMGVRCMVYVLGGDPATGRLPHAPRPIARFFRGCTQQRAKTRPQDAHSLLAEFTELVEKMWGPRVFREFPM